MEHFAVIQSLCRIGLADGNPKFRQQVERLRDRLSKAGDNKDLETIERLLEAEIQATKLEPSRVELSRSAIVGEELTKNVHPPVDKETSAPLADFVWPGQAQIEPPVFEPHLEGAIDAIIQEWSQFDELHKLGVAPSRSCLLYGAPGTGKTHTALTIARRLNLPVINVRLDGLVSSFLGTTARNIANLFEFANRYRCILLLDEFDAIAKLRDDPQEVGEIKRVVNTLLQNLDQRSAIGITVAITNHPSLLDPAIWRRFEVRIELPLPGAKQRESLVRRFLNPLPISDAVVQLMTWAMRDCTGADIKTMANAVKRYIALNGKPGNVSLLVEALTAHSRISASPTTQSRLLALHSDEKAIAKELLTDSEIKFTQATVATLLDRDQATISRWINEEVV